MVRRGPPRERRIVSGLVASAAVSPIYVAVTNPLSRLEVIMQTSKISGNSIGVFDAVKEVIADSKQFEQLSGVSCSLIMVTVKHMCNINCYRIRSRGRARAAEEAGEELRGRSTSHDDEETEDKVLGQPPARR